MSEGLLLEGIQEGFLLDIQLNAGTESGMVEDKHPGSDMKSLSAEAEIELSVMIDMASVLDHLGIVAGEVRCSHSQGGKNLVHQNLAVEVHCIGRVAVDRTFPVHMVAENMHVLGIPEGGWGKAVDKTAGCGSLSAALLAAGCRTDCPWYWSFVVKLGCLFLV